MILVPKQTLIGMDTLIEEEMTTETRQELFLELYQETFPKVAVFIRQHGGNLDDARDIFQDSLVVFYEKKQLADFELQVNEQAYLVGICKFLWYKKHRMEKRIPQTELPAELMPEDETEPTVSERLMLFLETAGKKCMDLLRAFYYDKKSMREIADQFEFSGERSATAQKFKCLEKVRETIREKSLNQDDFYA